MNNEKENYLKLAKEILGEGKSIDELINAARKIENYFLDRIEINKDHTPVSPYVPSWPGVGPVFPGIQPWPKNPGDGDIGITDPYKSPIMMFNKTSYEI